MERNPGFRVARDVGGVRGLFVAFNVFSEGFERRMFQLPIWGDPEATVAGQKRPKRQASSSGAAALPPPRPPPPLPLLQKPASAGLHTCRTSPLACRSTGMP